MVHFQPPGERAAAQAREARERCDEAKAKVAHAAALVREREVMARGARGAARATRDALAEARRMAEHTRTARGRRINALRRKEAGRLGGKRPRPPSRSAARRLPPGTVGRLRPLLHNPERHRSRLEARGGRSSPPPAAPRCVFFLVVACERQEGAGWLVDHLSPRLNPPRRRRQDEAARVARPLRERHEEQLAEAGHELGDPAEVLAKVRRLDPRKPPPLPRAPRRAPADTAFASCARAARDLPVARR